MKLTVLGGAAACPNPGQGCSSYLVEEGGASLLLDCGPDTLSVLREVTDYRAIDAIIISHTHADHTLDLIPYRYGLRYEPGEGRRKIPLWMPPGGTSFLERLASALAHDDEGSLEFFESTYELSEYATDREYETGPFSLRFMRTFHAIPCWAVRLEAGGQSLTYLADSSFHQELIEFAKRSNIVICEGTVLESLAGTSSELQTHMTAAQAGELASAAGADQLILTHLWSALGYENYEAEAAPHFSGELHRAVPQLVVETG